jgi:phosphohistidine phosphatase
MAVTHLYLVRHAIAAERGDEWPDDSKRPLTERGIARFKAVVRGFARLEDPVEEILTSPLTRARQTAALLAAAGDAPPPVRLLRALAPGHDPEEVLDELEKAIRRRRVALVGHEPGLGELTARLLGADQPLPFRKGGMCRIDLTLPVRQAGSLVWFMPPRALRGLSKTGQAGDP